MKNLIIFDFDGTVVDTITDVSLCFNAALRKYGFPEHPLSSYPSFVGGNLETIVARLLPSQKATESNITAVKTAYRQLYLSNPKPNTKPYPGMLELLFRLKEDGHLLAINSNKGQVLLDDMVSKLFPPQFFDAVVGYQENRPSKPDPYGVDLICAKCGCSRTDCIYVGDGHSDIATADNAGIPCVFVTWGQGSEEVRTDSRVTVCVETPQQLLQYLMKEESHS